MSSSLTRILRDMVGGEDRISVGRVSAIGSGGEYSVEISGKLRRVMSATGDLRVGDTVVVADTKTGKYAVGSGLLKSKKTNEVIING